MKTNIVRRGFAGAKRRKINSFGGDSVEAKNEFIGTKCR
jgi:hypothetical protein